MGQGLFTKVKQVTVLLATGAERSLFKRTPGIWLHLMDVCVPPQSPCGCPACQTSCLCSAFR